MKKPKLIFGVALVFLGSSIMLTGMVLGIRHFASGTYRDIHTFPISLTQENGSQQNLRFRTRGKIDFSFWLKMPDRKIENKKFRFGVALVNSEGVRKVNFEENFRFGYLRNSAGQGQYYRLGRFQSENEFNGYLKYRSSGKWRPTSDGYIVLRRQEPLAMPVKSIWTFFIGLAGLIAGIGTMVKFEMLRRVSRTENQLNAPETIHFETLENHETLPN